MDDLFIYLPRASVNCVELDSCGTNFPPA
jgi:hypothetical protein